MKSRAIIADRIKQFKRDERKKKEDYENQMIKILTKVYEQPLLLEGRQEKSIYQRQPGESNVSKDKREAMNEDEYLDDYYKQKQRADFKLDLGNQRKGQPHMDDEARRAVIEGHHLGQYPPEGYEPDYD